MEVQVETKTHLARLQLHYQTTNKHCKYKAVGLEALLFIRQFMSVEVLKPQLRKKIDGESVPSNSSC